MRTLIFLPYGGISPHHFSIGLEIIQQKLDQGAQVTVLSCNAKLNSCSFNLKKERMACESCKCLFDEGLKLLGHDTIKVKNYLLLTRRDKQYLEHFEYNGSSLEELMALKFENYDLGMGVASSIISYYRDPRIDLAGSHHLVGNLLYASLEVYLSTKNHLASRGYDEVYAFSGRYSEFRAVFRAAQDLGVPINIYEYGSDIGKYSVFHNHLPHSIIPMHGLIEQAWTDCVDLEYRQHKAEEFYKLRKSGVGKAFYSFTSGQDSSLLPPDFRHDKKNIAIFSSSEDELIALGDEWINKLYKTQVEGIRSLLKGISALPDSAKYRIYLRIHPNEPNFQEYEKIRDDNNADLLSIISPDSPISSYNLLEAADVVLSFGSTMGVEATFWGKPSIQLGPSFYQYLDCTYIPETHQQVLSLISRPDIPPKAPLGALKYGFYMNTFGVERKISKMNGFISLDNIKGVKLEPRGLSKLKLDILFTLQNPSKFVKLKLDRFQRHLTKRK